MIEEIFSSANGNQEELSFEEWKTWFVKLEGVERILGS
jgi:hypothetical protein